MHVYVCGSHAMHANGRGHSILFVTMEKGAMMNVPKKLGTNTVISTETEIVSNGERFYRCAWFCYFRLAQGRNSKEEMLMQDNKSCALIHNSYPFSTSKGTKHIHIRRFFAADKIKKKEERVEHCPTEKMIANYSTKPTQGSLFVFQRNTMQGINEQDFGICKSWY